VGVDTGTSVVEEYVDKMLFKFTGKLTAVRDVRYGMRDARFESRITYLASRIIAKWTGVIHRVNDMRGRCIIDRAVNGRRGDRYGRTAI
jgi:hypothetical protein